MPQTIDKLIVNTPYKNTDIARSGKNRVVGCLLTANQNRKQSVITRSKATK